MYEQNVNPNERYASTMPYYGGTGQSHLSDSIYEGQLMVAREMAKMDIALQKQDRMLQRKLEYEKAVIELEVYYEQLKQLLAYQVYADEAGNVIFSLTDPKDEEIVAKPLLKVKGYKTVILKSYYPEPASALQISWYEQKVESLIFLLGPDGIDAKKFLKAIKAKGLMMQVAIRAEKQAAEALLAFSLNSAKQVEIPGVHGWNQMKNGSWHYAHERELTFKEVKCDAYTR